MGKYSVGQSVAIIATGKHAKIHGIPYYADNKYSIVDRNCIERYYEEELGEWPPTLDDDKIAAYLQKNLRVETYVDSYEYDNTSYINGVRIRLYLGDTIISESKDRA